MIFHSSLESKSKTTQSQDRASPYPKLPAALDSHNYAKSPLMEGLASGQTDCQPHYEDYSGSDYSDDESRLTEKDISDDASKNISCSEVKMPEASENSMMPLSINTSPDILRPLSIQTKFETSPAPSASSTDTSSEVGSAFNSPVQSMHSTYSQGSPNSTKSCKQSDIFEDVRDIKKFVVIRMSSGCTNDMQNIPDSSVKDGCKSGSIRKSSDSHVDSSGEPALKRIRVDSENSASSFENVSSTDKQVAEINSSRVKHSEIHENCDKTNAQASKHPHLIEPHRFAPKVILLNCVTFHSFSYCNYFNDTEIFKGL